MSQFDVNNAPASATASATTTSSSSTTTPSTTTSTNSTRYPARSETEGMFYEQKKSDDQSEQTVIIDHALNNHTVDYCSFEATESGLTEQGQLQMSQVCSLLYISLPKVNGYMIKNKADKAI